MTLPVATKNAALNGVTIDTLSLHTDFPGSVGSNEVTGAPYARASVAFSTPAGGQEVMTSTALVSVPACTVRWLGFWSSGVFRACVPNGGAAPKNFMALASTSTIYSANHGYAADQAIVFHQGTAPGGLTEGTTYYAVTVATDTFQVAVAPGGGAISLTAPASFGCVVSTITEATFATAGQMQVTAATVSVPD